MAKTHNTREGWLFTAVEALDKGFFASAGYELPEKLQVSCGFPRAASKAIGQCWDPEASADGTTQMFVCPSLGNAVTVLAVLLHEMIHASVGIKIGHKGIFRKLAKEFGLAGKMTATFAEEGSELHLKLEKMSSSLGKYPHAPMQKRIKRSAAGGWVRLASTEVPEYRVTISPKMLEGHGVPVDPWGNDMEPVN